MKINQNFLFFFFFSISSVAPQQSKSQMIENINTWYENHPDKYSLSLNGSTASAKVTRYHPERQDEKNDLIEISYKGMEITLAFSRPLDEISTHKDSLQKYFSYVAIDDIYNNIVSDGWDTYPRTPSSSLSKGVHFNAGGDSISLTINWSIYTVLGYKDSKKCNNERGIMDSGISESCYVSVDKNLPLEIIIDQLLID